LRVAGAVFTKVLHPLVKRWRSFGYQIIMYLDDGWASHDEYTCRLVSKKGSGRFVKRRIRREQRKKHLDTRWNSKRNLDTFESLHGFRYENIQILGHILSSCYLYVRNSKPV
jgi:hypothetical protein